MVKDRKSYEKRRREYAEKLPAHYCPKCTSVVYPEDSECLECGSSKPSPEWPSIQDGTDPWIGRILDGRYLVTRRVGQGASGSVYRAESLAISREFAIKIINFKNVPSGVEPEQIRARLHREIEAISRLRNPHVVPFYEVIELYDHYVGIVMDFVDGVTLEGLVKRKGRIAIKRAAHLLRQIANGVHEAHEAGMIHRDLKPENIMVERMPAGDDFVHVLDFGIVRLDDGVSMTRGFLGTPLYASPEQAMAGEVDRRSDIYSLGAIFFFMLTGRPPFVSDNVYEILRAHVRSAAPGIDSLDLDIEFPPELVELVDAMLAKSPINRPQTLNEVINRIDHLIRSGRLDIDDAATAQPPMSPRKDAGVQTSQEMPPIAAEAVRPKTGPQPPIDSDVGTDSSEGRFHREERPESDSFLVSAEHDHTGPKAAIFRRNPSRNSLREMVVKSKETLEHLEFDRRLQSDTGVFTPGIEMASAITRCAYAPVSGRGHILALADAEDRVFLAMGTQVEEVFKAPKGVRSLAVLGENQALVGLDDGSIYLARSECKARRVFQDVRRAPISALATDASGKTLIAGSTSGRVYMCRASLDDLTSWSRIQDGPPVLSLALARDGSLFAVGRKHGETEIYNVGSPKAHTARFTTSQPVKDLRFSNDGHLMAALMPEGVVALHMVLTGSRTVMLKDESHTIETLGFNSENELVGFFWREGIVLGIDLQRELATHAG